MPPRPSSLNPNMKKVGEDEEAAGSMGSTVVSVLTALLSIPALAGA